MVQALSIPESSLASAFYEGCGSVFEFLGGQIGSWIENGINFIGNAAKSFFNAVAEAAKKAWSFTKAVASWLFNSPLGTVVRGGVSLIVAPIAAIGGCLKGAYDTALGKWVAAGIAVFATIMAAKYLIPAGILKFLAPIALAGVARWLVGATQQIWRFNWNISNAEIEAQNKGRIDALYSLLGSALGATVGQLVCGAVPGVATVAINPRMLIHIKRELGEEIAEEIYANLYGLATGTARAYKQNSLLNAYRNIRHVVKGYNQNPAFREMIGEQGAKIVDKWGEPGSKPWTFAQAFENKIESIQEKNKRLGNFLEEFFEELFENCGEVMILWADAVDSFRYP